MHEGKAKASFPSWTFGFFVVRCVELVDKEGKQTRDGRFGFSVYFLWREQARLESHACLNIGGHQPKWAAITFGISRILRWIVDDLSSICGTTMNQARSSVG